MLCRLCLFTLSFLSAFPATLLPKSAKGRGTQDVYKKRREWNPAAPSYVKKMKLPPGGPRSRRTELVSPTDQIAFPELEYPLRFDVVPYFLVRAFSIDPYERPEGSSAKIRSRYDTVVTEMIFLVMAVDRGIVDEIVVSIDGVEKARWKDNTPSNLRRNLFRERKFWGFGSGSIGYFLDGTVICPNSAHFVGGELVTVRVLVAELDFKADGSIEGKERLGKQLEIEVTKSNGTKKVIRGRIPDVLSDTANCIITGEYGLQPGDKPGTVDADKTIAHIVPTVIKRVFDSELADNIGESDPTVVISVGDLMKYGCHIPSWRWLFSRSIAKIAEVLPNFPIFFFATGNHEMGHKSDCFFKTEYGVLGSLPVFESFFTSLACNTSGLPTPPQVRLQSDAYMMLVGKTVFISLPIVGAFLKIGLEGITQKIAELFERMTATTLELLKIGFADRVIILSHCPFTHAPTRSVRHPTLMDVVAGEANAPAPVKKMVTSIISRAISFAAEVKKIVGDDRLIWVSGHNHFFEHTRTEWAHGSIHAVIFGFGGKLRHNYDYGEKFAARGRVAPIERFAEISLAKPRVDIPKEAVNTAILLLDSLGSGASSLSFIGEKRSPGYEYFSDPARGHVGEVGEFIIRYRFIFPPSKRSMRESFGVLPPSIERLEERVKEEAVEDSVAARKLLTGETLRNSDSGSVAASEKNISDGSKSPEEVKIRRKIEKKL